MTKCVLRVCTIALLFAVCEFAAALPSGQSLLNRVTNAGKSARKAASSAGGSVKRGVSNVAQRARNAVSGDSDSDNQETESPAGSGIVSLFASTDCVSALASLVDFKLTDDLAKQLHKVEDVMKKCLNGVQKGLKQRKKDTEDEQQQKKLDGQIKWINKSIKILRNKKKSPEELEWLRNGFNDLRQDKVPKNAAAVAGLMLAVASSLLALLAF